MNQKDSGIDITDIFCGCGGSSTGAVQAHDHVQVKMAINHWDLAVETHNTNHPNTDHDCLDISACDPRRYPSTRILWASPECTNHSLAKGQKRSQQAQLDAFSKEGPNPAHERSRATMWDVPRFTEYHQYDIVIVENVVDARRWVMWPAWLSAMHCLGYEHEVVYLNSMFCLPTPQSRDRIYVVFWRKGVPKPDLNFRPKAWCPKCEIITESVQAWRNTKLGRERWGKYRSQYDYACPACATVVTPFYYAAFNCIDWSIKAERIRDRKRPLAKRTMDRIRHGLKKYGSQPLVITGGYTSGVDCRVRQAVVDSMPTQPGGPKHGLLSPYFVQTGYSHAGKKRAYDSMRQLPTQTAQQSMAMVAPPFLSMQYTTELAHGLDKPTGTVTQMDHHAVVAPPSRVVSMNQNGGLKVTGGGHHALVSNDAISGFLAHFYGGGGQDSGLDDPIPTVTTTDRSGVVDIDPGELDAEDCSFRMLKPHEISRAMAFPSDYVVLGNQRDQVKQLGNAVTPPASRVIIERCVETLS